MVTGSDIVVAGGVIVGGGSDNIEALQQTI